MEEITKLEDYDKLQWSAQTQDNVPHQMVSIFYAGIKRLSQNLHVYVASASVVFLLASFLMPG